MQDRLPPARRNHLQRTAGPYIGSNARFYDGGVSFSSDSRYSGRRQRATEPRLADAAGFRDQQIAMLGNPAANCWSSALSSRRAAR
jgi:hypothetical protein